MSAGRLRPGRVDVAIQAPVHPSGDAARDAEALRATCASWLGEASTE